MKIAVPHFPTPEDASVALEAKNCYDPEVTLYMRDGTKELSELEGKLAQFAGMKNGELLAYNSGMSAVVQAIELADLTHGDMALFADGLYSQFHSYQQILKERGVKIRAMKSGNASHVRTKMLETKPKVVVAETVANTPNSNVLDVEALLDVPTNEEWDPLFVLDPTMHTPSGRYFAELLSKTGKRVLMVESNTKNVRLNTGLLGSIYSKRDDLMEVLRRRRRTTGSIPDVSSTHDALETAPSNGEFHRRNRSILENTRRFAKILFEETRHKSHLSVVHPNLPDHPNYAYAQEKYPFGASQCLFVRNPDGLGTEEGLLRAMWEAVEGRVHIGQSFGFPITRYWDDGLNPSVRISCGTENAADLEEMAEATAKALVDFSARR